MPSFVKIDATFLLRFIQQSFDKLRALLEFDGG